MGQMQGKHRDKFGRFKFLVDIDGFKSFAFQSAEGLKHNIAKIEYWEGGSIIAYKEPGLVTFDDLALSRGVAYEQEMYDWVIATVDLVTYAVIPRGGRGGGQRAPGYEKDLTVQQLERDNTLAIEYDVFEAFPVDYTASGFDNTSNEISMESLTLTYSYYLRTTVGSALAA